MTINPSIALLALMCLVIPVSAGAELRTFALDQIAKDRPVSHQPGLVYHLAETRIGINLLFGVDRVTETSTKKEPDGKLTTTKVTYYLARLSPEQKNQLSLTYVDSPAMGFLLVSESGFLVDAKTGGVKFFPDSSRLSTVGIEYDDKTAEAIKSVIDVLAEATGIAIKAAIASIDNEDKSLTTQRETVEEVSTQLKMEVSLMELLATNKVPASHLESPLAGLEAVNEKLLVQLKRRLKKEERPEAEKPRFVGIDGKLELSATQVLQTTALTNIMRTAPKSADVDGVGEVRYFPGILVTVPASGCVTLHLGLKDQDLAPVASLPARFPETGRFTWLEMTSKMFATVHPDLTLASDGSVSEFKFSSLTKEDKIFENLKEAEQKAGKALDDLKKSESDKKATAAADALSKAQLDFKLAKLQGGIDDKKAEIADIEAKLATAKPEETDSLKVSLRTQKRALALMEKRLEWLKKGIEIEE